MSHQRSIPPSGAPPDGSLADPSSRRFRTIPARWRLLVKARRAVLSVLVVIALLSGALGWVASSLAGHGVLVDEGVADEATGRLLVRLALAQIVVLAGVASVAVAIAWRSTRVVEGMFRAEDQLMRTIAHEVKTPLNRLLLAIDATKGDRARWWPRPRCSTS